MILGFKNFQIQKLVSTKITQNDIISTFSWLILKNRKISGFFPDGSIKKILISDRKKQNFVCIKNSHNSVFAAFTRSDLKNQKNFSFFS